MNEEQRFKLQVDRGLLVAGMQASPGWRLLQEEIEKMLEAYKSSAVSKEYLNKPVEHASLVGAYNALRSLLDLLTGAVLAGKEAQKQLEVIKERDREERRAAHAVRRI